MALDTICFWYFQLSGKLRSDKTCKQTFLAGPNAYTSFCLCSAYINNYSIFAQNPYRMANKLGHFFSLLPESLPDLTLCYFVHLTMWTRPAPITHPIKVWLSKYFELLLLCSLIVPHLPKPTLQSFNSIKNLTFIISQCKTHRTQCSFPYKEVKINKDCQKTEERKTDICSFWEWYGRLSCITY